MTKADTTNSTPGTAPPAHHHTPPNPDRRDDRSSLALAAAGMVDPCAAVLAHGDVGADPAASKAARMTGDEAQALAAVLGLPIDDGDADAELIVTCGQVVAAQEAILALHGIRKTTKDDLRTQPELDLLYDERGKAFDRLTEIDNPTTLAGAAAMARVCLVLAPRNSDAEISWQGDAEWCGFAIAEYLVERSAAA